MKLSRRIATLSLVAAAALWSGCTVESRDEDDDDRGSVPPDNTEEGGACQSDNDCKGDRICQEQVCVDPSDGGPPPDGGEDTATLLVSNESETTVLFFQARGCGATEWSGDLLGSEIIPGGGSVTWSDVPIGCYDFRAEAGGDVGFWEFEDIVLTAGETQQIRLLP